MWLLLPGHGRSRGTLQPPSSYRTRTGIWRTCTEYPGILDETKKWKKKGTHKVKIKRTEQGWKLTSNKLEVMFDWTVPIFYLQFSL